MTTRNTTPWKHLHPIISSRPLCLLFLLVGHVATQIIALFSSPASATVYARVCMGGETESKSKDDDRYIKFQTEDRTCVATLTFRNKLPDTSPGIYARTQVVALLLNHTCTPIDDVCNPIHIPPLPHSHAGPAGVVVGFKRRNNILSRLVGRCDESPIWLWIRDLELGPGTRWLICGVGSHT